MTGRMAGSTPLLLQQDLARVVLQQERFGHDQPVEHPDDVAVRRTRASGRRCRDGGWCRSVVSSTISYFVNGATAASGAVQKNPMTAPPGRSIARSAAPAPAAAGFVEVSRRSPSTGCRRRWRRPGGSGCRTPGQLLERACRGVPIDVREQILDEHLAAELLAEERDVGADDRAEVEQHRRLGLAGRQRGEELRERLGRDDRLSATRGRRDRAAGVGLTGALAAPVEKV